MSTLYRQDGGRLTLEDNIAAPTRAEGILALGMYNSATQAYTSGDVAFLQMTSDGRLMTDTNITVSNLDVQLGAVELKDATTDTRAKIKTDGTDNALVVMMNSGLVASENVIGQVKLTDGVDVAEIIGGRLQVQVSGTGMMVSQTNAASLNCTEASAASILTAVQLIDDVVYADAASWTDATSKHALVGGLYQATPQTVGTGTVAPIEIDVNGNLKVVGTAAAGTAAGGVLTIQGVASMTAVQVADNSSSLTVDSLSEYTDDADWSNDSSKHLLVGGLYASAVPNVITDGDTGPIALNASGEVKVVQATAANLNVTEASAATISSAVATPTTLTGGSETVDAVGTAQVIGTTLAIKSIYIRAKSTNTSFICVGDSTVDESTNQQIILYANDSVTIDIANRVTVWIDADVINEGVDYLCMS